MAFGDIPSGKYDRSNPRSRRTYGQPGQVLPNEAQSPGAPQDPAPFYRLPNHTTPPLDAETVDLYTNPTVVLPISTANVAILTYSVPDGCVGLLNKFGNDLENPAAFLQITWRFLWKGQNYNPSTNWSAGVVRTYTWNNFRRSLGNPIDPTLMSCPIILEGPGVFVLEADNVDVVQHFADARLCGYQWKAGMGGTNAGISDQYMT